MKDETAVVRSAVCPRREAVAAHTLLEVMIVTALFVLIVLAVGTAFGTGGEVYGEGLLRADMNAYTRQVLNRILSEVRESRIDAPYFSVGEDFITYNQVVAISADGPVFGKDRMIKYIPEEDRVVLQIPEIQVEEDLTSEASELVFTFQARRLEVSLTIERANTKGQLIRQTLTGYIYIGG